MNRIIYCDFQICTICAFNSEILTDDENLQIPGYSIARFDHPSNIKHGGVCVYYKTSLPLKLLDIKYLQKCINLELIIGDIFGVLLYFIGHEVKLVMILQLL